MNYFFSIYLFFMEAIIELKKAYSKKHIFFLLATQDIKSRYSRSVLGVFWLTINICINISVLGFVFGYMLTDRFESFFPHLVIGILFWNLYETFVTESATTYIDSSSLVLQTNIPLLVYLFRVLLRAFIVFIHNVIIIPFLFIFFDLNITFTSFMLAVYATILMVIFCFSIGIFLSFISVRFRDFPSLFSNITRTLFFFTPIIWMTDSIKSDFLISLVKLNPLYWFLKIFRDPLLYGSIEMNYFIASTAISIILFILSMFFYGKYFKRLPYWL